MKKIFLISVLLFLVSVWSEGTAEIWSGWNMSGGNALRHNSSDLSFQGLELSWQFDPNDHVWEYRKRMSVWSEACVGFPQGRGLVFLGSYDRNIYAVDLLKGTEAWRFTTGLAVNSCPVYLENDSQEMVIALSTDRVIYCLDAATGKKIWNRDIYPWTFTVFEGISPSPLLIHTDDGPRLILSIWFADNKPLRNRQEVWVICMDPSDGREIWKTRLGRSYLFPLAASIDDDAIYACSDDGSVYRLSASDGKIKWKFTTSSNLNSGPAVIRSEKKNLVFACNMFGIYYALDAENGRVAWRYKLGMQSIYPGAIQNGEQDLLYVSNFDRNLYCFDTFTGKHKWSFKTGKYVASCPLAFRFRGKDSVIFPSLDNTLYILDSSGNKLWEHELGEKLWAYETRGWTLWPCTVPVQYKGKRIILPWYDGKIYCFKDTIE